MKPTKPNKLLCCFLILVSCLFTVSCGEKAGNSGEELLCGFESYEELVNVRYLTFFGKVSQQDKSGELGSYISEGKYGLKVEVKGDYTKKAMPAMVLDTVIMSRRSTNEEYGFVTKSDFSGVSALKMEAYNANDSEQKISLCLQTENEPYNMLTTPITVSIAPKTYKTCVFELDREFISHYLDLKRVTQIRLLFENETEYMQPQRVFFIDNLRALKGANKSDASKKYRVENELESADRPEYLKEWVLIGEDDGFYRPCTLNYSFAFKKSGMGSFYIENAFQTGYWGPFNSDHEEGILFTGKLNPSEKNKIAYSVYNDWTENINHFAVIDGQSLASIEIEPKKWIECTAEFSGEINTFALNFVLTGSEPARVYIDEIYFT